MGGEGGVGATGEVGAARAHKYQPSRGRGRREREREEATTAENTQ